MTRQHEPPYCVWLRKAENDLLAIRNNIRAKATPWDVVCFHAQQAVEKSLKAYLVSQNISPPRIHDLLVLLAACSALDDRFSRLETDCREISAYAVGVRYPDELFEPGKDEGLRAASAANRVVEMVKEFLSLDRNES